jgi:HK97 family phage major capsid protein
MSEETATIEKIGSTVLELRSVIEKVADNQKGLDGKLEQLDGVDKEKFKKIEDALMKHEEAHQKLLGEKASLENSKKENEERFQNLEDQLISAGSKSGVQNFKESIEYKGFSDLLCKGSLEKVDVQYKDALRTDQGSEGGFLVPEMLADSIVKKIEQISPVRQFARIRTRQVKTLNVPIRDTIPTATFEGEAEEATNSKSSYLAETMTAHRQTSVVSITRDQINFAGFDMETEIFSDVITAYAQSEGNKFLLGTGVKQPEGIITRAGTGANDVPFTETAASGVVSLDDVIKLSGDQKLGYNSVYSFNRNTLVRLRTERDSNGNYLWTFGAERFPTQINGFDYVLMQDMSNIFDSAGDPITGAFPVLFGDYFNGYNILDAVDMEVIRDDVTLKKQAMVEFAWHRWLDGRVVLGEAFQLLQIKA